MSEFEELVRRGNAAEETGEDSAAEDAYLRAVASIEGVDPARAGMLYINLGTNARRSGRAEDAIGFFQSAIERMDPLPGEAVLQSAHAHFNLGCLLWDLSDPRAPDVAKAALERYERHPYTQPQDRVDGQLLVFVTDAFLNKHVTERGLRETWKQVCALPFETLTQSLVQDFVGVFLPAMRQIDGERKYGKIRTEVDKWAGGQLQLDPPS